MGRWSCKTASAIRLLSIWWRAESLYRKFLRIIGRNSASCEDFTKLQIGTHPASNNRAISFHHASTEVRHENETCSTQSRRKREIQLTSFSTSSGTNATWYALSLESVQ